VRFNPSTDNGTQAKCAAPDLTTHHLKGSDPQGLTPAAVRSQSFDR
jgi:hypothetical protein